MKEWRKTLFTKTYQELYDRPNVKQRMEYTAQWMNVETCEG